MVFTAGHVPDVLVKYEEWLSQHDCLTKHRVCYSENQYSEASHRLQECPDLNKHVKRNDMWPEVFCLFCRNSSMRTLLLYWTFRYVASHSQVSKSHVKVSHFSLLDSSWKAEQMGCWMWLFHMTHLCLMQFAQLWLTYLLNEAFQHLFVLKLFVSALATLVLWPVEPGQPF